MRFMVRKQVSIEKKAIGIDIGGSNIRVGEVTESGALVHTFREEKDSKAISQIFRMVDKCSDFIGIGISAGGPLDSKDSFDKKEKATQYMEIKRKLEERYGVSCHLLHDCISGVLAEKLFGVGKEHENLVYVTFSTGIGTGIIDNGRLLLGKEGSAQEAPHFIVEVESKIKCGCGGYGHWEGYSSGYGIPNYARYLLETDYRDSESALRSKGSKLKAEDVFRMASKDEIANLILMRINTINGLMVANIINAYDPELITVGGSVMLNNSKLLLGGIRKVAASNTFNRMPRIIATPLGHDVCLIGAAAGVLFPGWISEYERLSKKGIWNDRD